MAAHEHDETSPPEAPDDQTAIASATRDAAVHVRRMMMAMRPGHDLGAIFARARELDPEAVPASAVQEAERVMAARPLPGGDAKAGQDVAALTPFTAALREEIVAGGRAQRAASPPRLRRPRTGLALGFFAAAAAVAVLYAIGPDLAELRRGASAGVEASAVGEGARGEDAASRAQPGPNASPVSKATRRIEAPPPAAPAAAEPGPASAEPAASEQAVLRDSREGAPGERPRRAKSPPVAATLEQEAQALWQAGRLAAAEKKYREIVRVSGRSARAEFAYGDLFALARQLRGGAGQVAMWREYLAAFPRGQFADDAHAGLCSQGPAAALDACWREYLERHPRGAHRAQAEAALAAAEAGDP